MKTVLNVLAVVLLCYGVSQGAEAKRQNVLFLISDDWISDDLTSTALSCYGNTICKTPNIDRLWNQSDDGLMPPPNGPLSGQGKGKKRQK